MLPCYAFLVLAALCGRHVVAQPRVTFPINAQLPAIAMADEAFDFTFSADTFSSEPEVDYTLGNAPPWLQLEGANRTLTGKPSKHDVGDVHFQIIATDSTGTATSDSSLLVLEQNSLSARRDVFTERISQAGRYSAPSTLLLYPQSYFHLIFGPDVFEGGDSSVRHYASSGNNTPLPAWLSFDSTAVAFVGTTPPLLTLQSSPQSFAFTLAASQFAGFSQSALHFQISVTNHILAFLQPTQKIVVAGGEEVTVPSLLGQLRLDGAPVDRSEITHASSNQPEWLQLNSQDLSFSGASPKDLRDIYFQLDVVDDKSNSASVEIQLVVAGRQENDIVEVFLGTINATTGQHFNYSFIDTSIWTMVHEVDVDIDVGPAEPWLLFSRANLTLQGLAPLGSPAGDFNVTLTVSEGGQVSVIEYLTVTLISSDLASTPTNGTRSATKSSSVPTSTTSSAGGSANQAFDSPTRKLVLMIVLPVLAVLTICLLAFMLWGRRQSQGASSQTNSVAPPMRENSRNSNSGNMVVLADSDGRSLSETSFEQPASSPPPRVELPWSLHGRPRNKLLSVVDEYDRDSPETRSSWDDMLMEVDSPMNSGLDAQASRQLTSPSATNRLLSSPEHSKSPLQWEGTLLTETQPTKQSKSFATLRRLNRRQSSGVGHGAGLPRMTVRQVPLSPLSETPGILSTPFHAISQSSMTPNYDVLQPNTSFVSKPTSTRQRSLASSESRYAAPQDGSNSELSSWLEKRATVHRSSSSMYEDDDWMTEGSASAAQSSSQHLRHAVGGHILASNDIFSGHEAARQWPLAQALPTATSQGMSLRSQVSEQSQGDSLRFI